MVLLADLTIVELPGPAGLAFCAKLFADAGARVVKVEPPEGAPDRAQPGPTRSGPAIARSTPHFLAFNTGKSSYVANPAAAGCQSELDTLIGAADLLLVGGPGADPYGAGERAAEWAERWPSLVVTQLTPFGAFGPRASWTSSTLVQYASSGWMHVTGRPGRYLHSAHAGVPVRPGVTDDRAGAAQAARPAQGPAGADGRPDA